MANDLNLASKLSMQLQFPSQISSVRKEEEPGPDLCASRHGVRRRQYLGNE